MVKLNFQTRPTRVWIEASINDAMFRITYESGSRLLTDAEQKEMLEALVAGANAIEKAVKEIVARNKQ
jgi:hypothetical protein